MDLRHFTDFWFHCHVGTAIGWISRENNCSHFARGIYYELVNVNDWNQWTVWSFHVLNSGGIPITMNTLVISIIINHYIIHIIPFDHYKFVDMFLVNNQHDALFFPNVFISLLCMFPATQCSSSGESIVSIHHLVYVTLCRWLPGMPVGRERHTKQSLTQMMYWYNWFSWWWALGCSKNVEKWNKYIEKIASSWLLTRIVPRCTVNKV